MLIAGQLMLERSGESRGVELREGWLRIDPNAGFIGQLGLGPPPARPDLGSSETLVLPGFCDTHLHLPQFDSIGADGMELLPWLHRVVFPAEARWADADYAGEMATRVAGKLLSHGTVSVAAYATVHHAAARNAIRALGEAGLAGVVGQVLMDQQAPADLVRPCDQLLLEAADHVSAGRVSPAVTPRFAVSCSSELLSGAGRLAKATGWAVQTHLSETPDECQLVRELHGGLDYTEVYRRAGLLGPRSLLGHGIWVSDDERRVLADTGAIVAHCPTANLFLQAGAMDRAAHARNGVRMSLGSDIAGGPDVSMPRVARAMIETVKSLRLRTDPSEWNTRPIPTASEAWWQITAGNCDAVGLKGGGRLAVGAPADLVIAAPGAGPHSDSRYREAIDPLGALLYGWDQRWIRNTMAAGRVVYSV